MKYTIGIIILISVLLFGSCVYGRDYSPYQRKPHYTHPYQYIHPLPPIYRYVPRPQVPRYRTPPPTPRFHFYYNTPRGFNFNFQLRLHEGSNHSNE